MDIITAIDRATGCQYEPCGRPLGDSPSDDFCSPGCQQAWSAARTAPLDRYDEPFDLAAHAGNLAELHHPETCATCVDRALRPIRLLPDDVWNLIHRQTLARRGWSFEASTAWSDPTASPLNDLLRWVQVHRAVQQIGEEYQRNLAALAAVVRGVGSVILDWDGIPGADTSRLSGPTVDLAHIHLGERPVPGEIAFDMICDIRHAAHPEPPAVPAEVRERALTARRNRNTGPPPPRRRAPRHLPARRSR